MVLAISGSSCSIREKRTFDDAGIDHGQNASSTPAFTIAIISTPFIEVLARRFYSFKLRRGFERGFTGLFTPCQRFIVVSPVSHHAGRVIAGDVIHVSGTAAL